MSLSSFTYTYNVKIKTGFIFKILLSNYLA